MNKNESRSQIVQTPILRFKNVFRTIKILKWFSVVNKNEAGFCFAIANTMIFFGYCVFSFVARVYFFSVPPILKMYMDDEE